MTLEILQNDMIAALKNKNMAEKGYISEMIGAIQKASITNKGRIEITEQLVNETLIKYQKSIQEQVDTCPADRPELKARYIHELETVKRYAPQLITDTEMIKEMINGILTNMEIQPIKSNRGKIMKAVMPAIKGKADSSIANKIINEMIK